MHMMCVHVFCAHVRPVTRPSNHVKTLNCETVTRQFQRKRKRAFFSKHVSVNIPSVTLRCLQYTEIIPQAFITTFLSTLTSVIRHTRPGTNLCLYSCLAVCLALPLNPSVPGVCNKRAGQSPCPWESIRGI